MCGVSFREAARGWVSAEVIGVGLASLVVLGAFVGWEARSSHPMLNLGFFSDRRFSVAAAAETLGVFGLLGRCSSRRSSCSSTSASRRCKPGLGGALAVAAHAGGAAGALLAHTARAAFMSGNEVALAVGAAVALVGVALVLARLPSRVRRDSPDPGMRGPAKGTQ